ncbi:MAG TPA: type II toxin-antitoxin system VapC family toxin [Herpetosiphonaceae bacterium]
MTKLVIVDTDVLIDVGRGIQDATVSLHNVAQQAALAVSVVTQMELFVGCRNSAELRHIDRFLTRFQIILVSEQISGAAVDLLRQYRLSHGLLIADSLIAGTALVLNESLLTKNQRDYRFIRGLNLLAYPYP